LHLLFLARRAGFRTPALERKPYRGDAMDPVKLSAQFAAYVWYTNIKEGSATTEEQAVRFARTNWSAFLPCAHRGLGRLLSKMAAGRLRHRYRDLLTAADE
jgi:hypothetical protein